MKLPPIRKTKGTDQDSVRFSARSSEWIGWHAAAYYGLDATDPKVRRVLCRMVTQWIESGQLVKTNLGQDYTKEERQVDKRLKAGARNQRSWWLRPRHYQTISELFENTPRPQISRSKLGPGMRSIAAAIDNAHDPMLTWFDDLRWVPDGVLPI